ncbi:MAG: hypothetical protein ABI818_05470 [Acidobacteriota bacterium]
MRSPQVSCPLPPRVSWQPSCKADGMFGFFSSRLGCAGSLLVSVIGTIVLILLMRGCSGPVGY